MFYDHFSARSLLAKLGRFMSGYAINTLTDHVVWINTYMQSYIYNDKAINKFQCKENTTNIRSPENISEELSIFQINWSGAYIYMICYNYFNLKNWPI